MTRNYEALENSLSENYKNAGSEALGEEITKAANTTKPEKEKGRKRMPSKLDGKVYAFPGEILSGSIEDLVIGQNAYVPLNMLVQSDITSRDYDFEFEIAQLQSGLAKASAPLGDNEEEGESRAHLSAFQELYLDIAKNGQVDALKVYRSKQHPGKLEPIEGNRRLVALNAHGYKYAYITLYPEPASVLDLVRLSQSFNQKRDRHSIFDLGKQWYKLTQDKVKQESIAKELGVSKSYISKAIAVYSLYKGTKQRIQSHPHIFSETMAIELAYLEKRLVAHNVDKAGFKVLELVTHAIDFSLKPDEFYALMKKRSEDWLEEPKPVEAKPIKAGNPFKQTSRLFAGEDSEPVGFLTVDSQSKNIRVGVNFSKMEKPGDFLSELKELVEKHGLRKNIEPKIFDESEIAQRIEAIEAKAEDGVSN